LKGDEDVQGVVAVRKKGGAVDDEQLSFIEIDAGGPGIGRSLASEATEAEDGRPLKERLAVELLAYIEGELDEEREEFSRSMAETAAQLRKPTGPLILKASEPTPSCRSGSS
jgi:hypothetical protein